MIFIVFERTLWNVIYIQNIFLFISVFLLAACVCVFVCASFSIVFRLPLRLLLYWFFLLLTFSSCCWTRRFLDFFLNGTRSICVCVLQYMKYISRCSLRPCRGHCVVRCVAVFIFFQFTFVYFEMIFDLMFCCCLTTSQTCNRDSSV